MRDPCSDRVAPAGRRDPAARRGRPALLLAWLLMPLWLWAARAWAVEVERPWLPAVGVDHTSYTSRQGAPNSVTSLAQTPDGLLWVGSRSGLYLFDGVSFTPFRHRGAEPLANIDIGSVDVGPAGDVWIGTRFGEVYHLQGETFTHYGAAQGAPMRSIWSFVQDRDGNVFLGESDGIRRLTKGRWEPVATAAGGSTGFTCRPMKLDPAGSLAVMNHEGRAFVLPARARQLRETGSASPYCGVIQSDPEGRLWNLARAGIHPFGEPARPRAADPWRLPADLQVDWRLIDRRGAVWGTAAGGLLVRLPCLRCALAKDRITASDIERIATPDQLGGTTGDTWLEDREGNVWIGTSGGLEVFRNTKFRQMVTPNSVNYSLVLTTDRSGALLAGGGRGLYAGDAENGLHPLPGYRDAPLASVLRARDGSVWAGSAAEGNLLFHSTREGVRAIELPGANRRGIAKAIGESDDGRIWVSLHASGLFSWEDGRWRKHGGVTGLPDAPPTMLASDDARGLWIGYRWNRLAVVRQGVARVFTAADGLHLGDIFSLLGDGPRTWIGGADGVALYTPEAGFQQLVATNRTALTGVSGIVKSASGDLWLNGAMGAVRIAQAELQRFLADPRHAVTPELFGPRAGISGVAETIVGIPTAAVTRDDHLWISTQSGLFHADLRHLARNEVVPLPLILSATADGHRDDRPASLRLPALTRSLEIDYTASSLVAPELVRFRYRLEGVDRDWLDAGSRRQAFYTNLPPGKYVFSVMAANEDGVWSQAPATLAIEIPPAYWQTVWFLVAGIAAGVLLLALAVHYRLRAAYAAEQRRAEDRIQERERISRELHDTLLQGVQGLVYSFQAVAGRLTRDDPTRTEMERLLDGADRVLGEARDRVDDLRSNGGVEDLPAALIEVGHALAAESSSRFAPSVAPSLPALDAAAAVEVYFAAREALTNAFRHADAETVALEIGRTRKGLRLVVRDDGRGIDASTLAEGGRPGHWGLRGMRERVQRVGGRWQVKSDPAGTRIVIEVPTSEGPGRRWRRRLARLRARLLRG